MVLCEMVPGMEEDVSQINGKILLVTPSAQALRNCSEIKNPEEHGIWCCC